VNALLIGQRTNQDYEVVRDLVRGHGCRANAWEPAADQSRGDLLQSLKNAEAAVCLIGDEQLSLPFFALGVLSASLTPTLTLVQRDTNVSPVVSGLPAVSSLTSHRSYSAPEQLPEIIAASIDNLKDVRRTGRRTPEPGADQLDVFLAAPFTAYRRGSTGIMEKSAKVSIKSVMANLRGMGLSVWAAHEEEQYGRAQLGDNEIASRDYQRLLTARALLVWPMDAFSGGMNVELGWATAHGKPLIIDMNEHAVDRAWLDNVASWNGNHRFRFRSWQDLHARITGFL